MVLAIHTAYREAGATVHTTNTFRTRERTCGTGWRVLAERAAELARAGAGDGRVAGSIAPLEDCYEPERSIGAASETEHQRLAEVLAPHCDLLLCETFAHPDEALAAVRAATSTGRPVWLALTAGPEASLLTPDLMAEVARRAVGLGVGAVLVNCTPALDTRRFLDAIAGCGVPIGAYANAGHANDEIGWTASPEPGAERYAELASSWVDAGAEILGSCCGTGPAHIRALAERFT